MKPLKPSMREKKRYLLIEGKNIKQEIDQAILDLGGILGLAKVSPQIIMSNQETAIICINRQGLDLIRASLVLRSNNYEIKRVSGSIKKIKEFLKQLNKDI